MPRVCFDLSTRLPSRVQTSVTSPQRVVELSWFKVTRKLTLLRLVPRECLCVVTRDGHFTLVCVTSIN